jgi:hypothetical protein
MDETGNEAVYWQGDPGVESTRKSPVDPGARRSMNDWIWPRLHRRWWFREAKTADEIEQIFFGDIKDTAEFLADVVEATRPAAERAGAAERRAATLAGAVAIAASLTTSGAGLVLDTDKIPESEWRVAFAGLFAAITCFLVLSGLYATRTIVGWRRWSWPNPWKSTKRGCLTADEVRTKRAAELLRGFSYNWEVADVKLRTLDSASRCFVVALLFFVLLALTVVTYVVEPSLLA